MSVGSLFSSSIREADDVGTAALAAPVVSARSVRVGGGIGGGRKPEAAVEVDHDVVVVPAQRDEIVGVVAPLAGAREDVVGLESVKGAASGCPAHPITP